LSSFLESTSRACHFVSGKAGKTHHFSSITTSSKIIKSGRIW